MPDNVSVVCVFAQDHDGLICTKVNLVIEVDEESKNTIRVVQTKREIVFLVNNSRHCLSCYLLRL